MKRVHHQCSREMIMHQPVTTQLQPSDSTSSLSRRLLRAVRLWGRSTPSQPPVHESDCRKTTADEAQQQQSTRQSEWGHLEVLLHKPAGGTSLGISLSGGGGGLCARVSGVRPGSVAHASDALSVGDYVTAVNGVRTERLRAEQVAALLHRADPGPVTLELQYELPCSEAGSEDTSRGNSRVVQVSLQRDDAGSLGFNLRGGAHPQHPRSLLVTQVRPGGPADRSGCVRPGDRLLAVDGVSLIGASLQDAHDLLRPRHGTVTSTLVRLQLEVDVMQAPRPHGGPLLLEVERAGGDPALGLALTAASADGGVLVAGVRPGSVADRCSALHAGDLILAVGTTRVHEGLGPMETAQLLASCGSPVRLQILPQHQPVWGSVESGLAMRSGLSPRLGSSSYLGSCSSGHSTLTSQRGGMRHTPRRNMTNALLDTGSQRGGGAGCHVSHSETLLVSLLPDSCGYGLALEGAGPPVIAALEPGSPADLSGCLQPGDRLLAVNQTPCETLSGIQAARLMEGAPSVALLVQFDVAEAVVPASGVFTVKLAPRGTEADLGISLIAPPRGPGLQAPIISEVRRGSAAHRSGALQTGDQLLEVGGVRMQGISEVSMLLDAAARHDVVTLRILKGSGIAPLVVASDGQTSCSHDLQDLSLPLMLALYMVFLNVFCHVFFLHGYI